MSDSSTLCGIPRFSDENNYSEVTFKGDFCEIEISLKNAFKAQFRTF